MRLEMNKASVSSLSPSELRHQIKLFVQKSSAERGNGVLIGEMESRVKECEALYCIKSSDLEEALRTGSIKEDEEVVKWIFAYNILKKSGKR
jgi:hypothetical protein